MQINQILKAWNEKKINKIKDENDSQTYNSICSYDIAQNDFFKEKNKFKTRVIDLTRFIKSD
jgi:hypothetical protein